MIKTLEDLNKSILIAMKNTRITDLHTHLFSESFGDLFLYGIDELLTYHYLICETFRYIDISYEVFWDMSKKEQAELVWKTLFIENTPISEACRHLLTAFKKLGLDINRKDLDYYRDYFCTRNLSEYIDLVFDIIGLDCVVMTNDPFDSNEKKVWDSGFSADNRFKTALRLDVLITRWEEVYIQLKEWGYKVTSELTESTYHEIRKFISDWINKIDALYCAASLPPTFSMEDDSITAKLIKNCVLPICKLHNLPLALMIGVKRRVNPALKKAGDTLGKFDIGVLERLATTFSDNKFMVTLLSTENQHELAVIARKFRNVMPFGCWWFLNTPSQIENITRIRMELLGTSFIPQHSDSRVFEHLIGKWEHSKAIIANILIEKYSDMLNLGYNLTLEQIQIDIDNLFGGNFWSFLGKQKSISI